MIARTAAGRDTPPDRWGAALLARVRGRPAPAFILGGASSQALGFLRSLGRRGIPAVALGTGRGPWAWSRHCVAHAALPTEAALLERLLDVGRRLPRKGVILATGDAEVLFLSRYRHELCRQFHFVLPPDAVVEELADKAMQYRCAARHGIAIPPTYFPESAADVEKIAGVARYPCIVKPARADVWRVRKPPDVRWRWSKVGEASTPDELRALWQWMGEHGVAPLIQERIEGDESRLYSVYLYLDRRSTPLAACVIQKRRQWPPRYGSGSYSVSCRQDRVLELAVTLLRRAGYEGLANVEFKLDPEDGEPKLMEVNCRGGERIALAMAAGADLPYVAYLDAVGTTPAPALTYAPGVTWINSLNDGAALLSHYRRVENLNVARWAWAALTAQSHAYFAADDPMPLFENLVRTARREAVPFGRVLRRGCLAPPAR
jgi:predicted ATP-grasp superfamily ATP-dependent carboligase